MKDPKLGGDEEHFKRWLWRKPFLKTFYEVDGVQQYELTKSMSYEMGMQMHVKN